MIVDLDSYLLEREHLVRSGAGLKPRFDPPRQRRKRKRWRLPPPKPARSWAARAKWDDLAKDVTGGFSASGRRAVVRVLWIHDLRFHDLTGRHLFKHLAEARIEAVRAVAAAQPGLSSVQLGRLFHRNHTTILAHLGRLRGKGPRR